MFGTLIASIASGEIAATAARLKSAMVAYAIAAFCGLFGLIFLLIALYVFVAERAGALQAAIGFAVVFFLVALVVVFVHRMRSRVVRRRARRRRGSEARALATTAAVAIAPAILARAKLPFLALPLLGAVGYAIYRENAGRRGPSRRRSRRGDF